MRGIDVFAFVSARNDYCAIENTLHTNTQIKSGKQQSHCTAHEWRNHFVYRFQAAELRDSFCFDRDYNEILCGKCACTFSHSIP